MDTITDFYSRGLTVGNMLILLSVTLFLLLLYLSIRKTPFRKGIAIVVLLQALLFSALAFKFYQGVNDWRQRKVKNESVYTIEIEKNENFRTETKFRIVVEIATVLIALFMLLKAKADSRKQGIGYALIICASLMFFIDLFIWMKLSDYIAELRLLRHNSSIEHLH